MAYTDKYYDGPRLDRDPVQKGVLASFERIVQGTADPRVFKMVSDEHARRFLDDEDYGLWQKLKRESERKTA